MDTQSLSARRRQGIWLSEQSGDFEVFKGQVEQATNPADWPMADRISKNVPVYAGASVRSAAKHVEGRQELMAE